MVEQLEEEEEEEEEEVENLNLVLKEASQNELIDQLSLGKVVEVELDLEGGDPHLNLKVEKVEEAPAQIKVADKAEAINPAVEKGVGVAV